MKKLFCSLCLTLALLRVAGQNYDTTQITIKDFRLQEGTFSWRGTGAYHDMNSWTTDPYTQGHLEQKSSSTWKFRMNYRLLHPQGYDAGYDPGYPIILFLHGAGERGNCWESDCYCSGCDANGTPDGNANPQYLNNDHQLLLGGQFLLNAVNLAGTKKPNDPTLNAKAFPGFVLFPQNENSWGPSTPAAPVAHALRILRLVIKKYNIDPDRVYIVGLSFGGQGVYKALNLADYLFAAAITMSAIDFSDQLEYDSLTSLPLWAFQGGNDLNPRPDQTDRLLKKFREAGGTPRFTLYPEAGHNTWSSAFKEPDFISWLLKRTKADLHVKYNNPNVCVTNGAGAELVLTKGFPAYQWEFNGAIIPNQSGSTFVATAPGKYRGRFSRVASPGSGDWNEWSNVVTIGEQTPLPASVEQIGTTYLVDLNGKTTALLKGAEGKAHYYWYKDGVKTDRPDSVYLDLPPGSCSGNCANAGQYTLVTADFDNCPSFPSETKYIFFENQAPIKNTMRPKTFTAEILSSSSTLLNWSDPSTSETAYEIWRLNTSKDGDKWQLATITRSNVTFYKDTMLIPGSKYYYKIRAINSSSRSDYFPGNNKTDVKDNLVVTLPDDHDVPQPPQNLTLLRTGANSVRLTWNSGKDESGLKEYQVLYGSTTVSTGSLDTTYVLKNLTINTTYAFTVKTVDISENVSPPSNQVMLHTNMTGLFYKHSTGAWKSLDESSLRATFDAPEHTGTVANFSLSPRVQDDYFNFEFEGYVFISTAGNYTFYINSNEGSRLYIDNTQIIDFNGTHGTCTGDASSATCPNSWGRPSSSIALSAGAHLIRVRYFDYTGSHALQVRYNGPDTGNSTVSIPDAALTSGTYTPPTAPSTPINFLVSSSGYTGIKLTWNASTGSNVSYEIYRATTSGGPYEIVNKIAELTYTDFAVVPGTLYYYRVRAVNPTGVSGFTSAVSGKTQKDTEAPSQPEGLRAESGNFTRIILRWDPSSDNVGVDGYEIWANGVLIGTSEIPAFDAYLESGQIYSFYVVAYDATGNKSAISTSITNEGLVTDVEQPVSSMFFVEIFPNPGSSGQVKAKIHTESHEVISVILSNPLGNDVVRDVLTPAASDLEYVLHGNKSMADGMYMLTLEQGGKVLHRKVMIRN